MIAANDGLLDLHISSYTPTPKVRQKNDPRLVAAARELKDRPLEQLNTTPLLSCGKNEVSRMLFEGQTGIEAARNIPTYPPMLAA